MDIKQLVKLVAQMSGMNRGNREKLLELIDEIDELEEIEDLNDLENVDFGDLEIEDFDIDTFSVDNFERSRPGKRSVDDYRHNAEKQEKDIDLNVSNSEVEKDAYHGETWIQVDDKYETVVKIPDEEDVEIDIELRDTSVYVSNPVDTELSTDQLPRPVSNVEAEVTEGNRLMLRVY